MNQVPLIRNNPYPSIPLGGLPEGDGGAAGVVGVWLGFQVSSWRVIFSKVALFPELFKFFRRPGVVIMPSNVQPVPFEGEIIDDLAGV